MIIEGIKFTRLSRSVDVWASDGASIVLRLDLSEPSRPWRVSYCGRNHSSKYTTPYVAVMRTLEKMNHEPGKRTA